MSSSPLVVSMGSGPNKYSLAVGEVVVDGIMDDEDVLKPLGQLWGMQPTQQKVLFQKNALSNSSSFHLKQ